MDSSLTSIDTASTSVDSIPASIDSISKSIEDLNKSLKDCYNGKSFCIVEDDYVNRILDNFLWIKPNMRFKKTVWKSFQFCKENSLFIRCVQCMQNMYFDRKLCGNKSYHLRRHVLQNCRNRPGRTNLTIQVRDSSNDVVSVPIHALNNDAAKKQKIDRMEAMLVVVLQSNSSLSLADKECAEYINPPEGECEENSIKCNSANLISTLEDTVLNIEQFWRSEFAKSWSRMNNRTFTDVISLKSAIFDRIKVLNEVNFISLVLDHWTDYRSYNYLGIVMTTFNKQNGKLVSFLLGLPNTTKHRSEDVLADLERVIRRFPGIQKTILTISSDNAANMLHLGHMIEEQKVFGEQYMGHVPCMLHSTNLMNGCIVENITKTDPEIEEDLKRYIESQKIQEAALKCQINSLGETINVSNDCHFTKFLLSTANSIFSSFVDEETMGHNILMKNNLLKHEMTMSNKKSDIFKLVCSRLGLVHHKKAMKLHDYCRTRWVSAIDTIRRLIRIKPALLFLAHRKEFENRFEEKDFEVAEKLLKLLLPFRKLCEILSNNSCTVKYALPFLMKYRKEMMEENISCLKDVTSGKRIISRLVNFSDKMTKYYNKYTKNNIHLMSCYLNIHFVSHEFWRCFVDEKIEGSRTLALSKTMANSYAELLLPYLNMSMQSTSSSFPDYRDLSTSSNYDHDPENGANYSDTDNNDNSSDDRDAEESFMDGDQPIDVESLIINQSSTLNEPQNSFDNTSIKVQLVKLLEEELSCYRNMVMKQKNKIFCSLHNNGIFTKEQIRQRDYKFLIASDRLFWSKFSGKIPILSFVESLFNNVPSTSICVERLFSTASLTITKKRHNLSVERLEQICIAKTFEKNLKFERINLAECNFKQAIDITNEYRRKKDVQVDPIREEIDEVFKDASWNFDDPDRFIQ